LFVHETAAHNLTEIFRGSNCFAAAATLCWRRMNEENQSSHRYKWPWFVLAAFIVFVALAILWMSVAVKRERQERDYNAPLPSTPAH
jgi:hypothetical protein